MQPDPDATGPSLTTVAWVIVFILAVVVSLIAHGS